MDSYLSKEDTKVIKGIAIVLMLMLHLWGFPDRIAGELKHMFNIFGISSLIYLGHFGNICVSIFFSVGGGYGTYISVKKTGFSLIGRIKDLYIQYWKVFFIYIPTGFLFFSNQPAYCRDSGIYTRFSTFKWQEMICNCLGIGISYNSEWWFLQSYIVALISFPFIKSIIEQNTVLKNMFIIIIASIFNNTILPSIGNISCLGVLNNDWMFINIVRQVSPFISAFWFGILCAHSGLLTKLIYSINKNGLNSPVFYICTWIVIIFFRQTAIGATLDFVYVPFLIIASIELLKRCGLLKRLFFKLGKHSTNIWLIHSFYCYYFYQIAKIIIYPEWAVISLIFLIFLSYISAAALDFFWKGILYGYSRINYKIVEKFRRKCKFYR